MDWVDAVVVGAGHAGLGVSHELATAGVEHVVLERGRIGETWRSQRWDTFRLNTPRAMNRLPGDPDPPPGSGDAFLPAGAFADQLAGYARHHRLPIREGSVVTRVEWNSSGLALDVSEPSTGARSRIRARAVIVASGIQNVGRRPALAAELPAAVAQLHSLDYRRAADLPDGAVVVFGGGQTGAQLVDDLLDAGRRVYWSVSMVPRCPRRYRGRDMFEWLVRAGFFDQRPAELPDPALRSMRQPLISGTGEHGHTVSLQSLAARGATLVGRIVSVDGNALILDDSVAACIRFGDEWSAKLRAMADRAAESLGEPSSPPDDPASRDAADLDHADPDALRFPRRLDLEHAGVRSVIWATGVTGDFGWLPADAVGADGAPAHEAGVTPGPGLYVTGFPWLTNRGSGIIYGAGGDARRIAERVAAR
jgi:putative flavoprotein involved in K+ transport